MSNFSPIVLLTDFGTRDGYAASMKGVILSIFPEARLVDLSHEVEPQNVKQAAFLLETAYRYFPPKTVFVSVVDPGVGSGRNILAAKTTRGIFLAPDNGLLTRILGREGRYELRIVTNRDFFLKEVSRTFHGRDCFAPAAARLARRPSLFSHLGPKVTSFKRLNLKSPRASRGKIIGEIIFFDHFGNAFSNISGDFLRVSRRRHPPQVQVKGKSLGRLRGSYFEVKKGKAVAVISSSNLVEIAVNHGSAQKKLKLGEGDRVEIL